LVRERHLVDVLALLAESIREETPQLLDRQLRPLRIAAHDGVERVERVEDEVRVELRAERLELGPRAKRLRRCQALSLLRQAGRFLPRLRDGREDAIEKDRQQDLPSDDAPVEAE